MKKIGFLGWIIGAILIFLTPGFVFADHYESPYEYQCLRVNGRVDADNWPGGSVRIWCDGRQAGDPIPQGGVSDGRCPGDSKEVAPGEEFSLHGCNCDIEGESGKCVQIENIPSACRVTSPNYCGANNSTLDNANITFSCEAPQGGEEPPPPPGEEPPPPPGEEPPPPPPPPTESTPPDASIPPDVPPPPPPVGPPPPPPDSPPPPPPPPPPSFNPAMCKCDGIESTLIFPGEPTTVTSYAKVEGSDLSAAQVKDQTFYLAKNSTVIAKSEPISATVIDQSSGKIRYKSTWQFTLPADVDKSAIYRVWSQQRCVKRSSNVLGLTAYAQDGTTNNKSFMDSIISFFGNLFGSTENPPDVNVPSNPEQNATPSVPTTNFDSSGRDKLQLQPLYPATIIKQSKDQSCRFLMFKFN